MEKLRQASNIYFLIGCFLFSAFSILKAQNAATWTLPVNHKSFDFYQDDLGNLIITEQGTISSINPKTGEAQWSLKAGDKVRSTAVEGTPLLILEGEKLRILDSNTGEVYFEQEGEKVSYKSHEVYPSKGKMILDYSQDGKPMVGLIDLLDFKNSVISQIKTKGGLFSGDLRLPSKSGAIFKNKKILTCLSTSGTISEYESPKKSTEILGGTQSGIATIVVKYKNFKGIDMSTCEVVWEFTADKQPFYSIGESDKVIVLTRKKTLQALDMETGELLYTLETDKRLGEKGFFHGGFLYYPTGSILNKYDARTGKLISQTDVDGYVNQMQFAGDRGIFMNQSGYNKIDLSTFDVQFDKSIKESNIVWQKNISNYYYYITAKEDGFAVYCYEDDKTQLWSKKLDGTNFKDAFITDIGLVAATDKQFTLFQNDDGDDLWKYKSKMNFAVSPNTDQSRFYGIVDDYSFYIDTKTGKLKPMPKFKLKDFNPKEQKSHVMVHNNSYIMKSGNNFYIRGMEGEEVLTKHYKKHSNASRWAKLGAVATKVGAVAVGGIGEISQVTDSQGNVVHQGSMYGDNNQYGRALENSRKRIANSSDLNLPFVFTKNDNKKKVFIFLDPLTGDEYKSIEIREEKPEYKVDTVDGILFYLNKKEKRLEAHML